VTIQAPPILLEGKTASVTVLSTWPQDGSRFQAYPFTWTTTINVTPQATSYPSSSVAYYYTGLDVTVGMWFSNAVDGRAWLIQSITSHSGQQLIVVLEDVNQYNTFADNTGNGDGSPPNLVSGFIFAVTTSNVPILTGVLPNVLTAQWQTDVLGRFAYLTSDLINTGANSLDDTVIGSVTPEAATFTNLTVTGTSNFPTLISSDTSAQVATTQWVQNQGYIGNTSLQNVYAPLQSPALTGTPTVPTAGTSDSSTKIANTSFVTTHIATAIQGVTTSSGGVSSFNTRTGSVTLTALDVTSSLGFTPANIAGASFSGPVTVPTVTSGDSSGNAASTSFVASQGFAKASVLVGEYAALNSPVLTGMPLAPTATAGTNTAQIATAAFVETAVNGIFASPTFTGIPAAPTANTGTNSTQLATTAYVANSLTSFAPLANPTFAGVVTIPNGSSIAGYVTTASASATFAPLASPTFTGTPVAPTASAGTNTTQIATTAFVSTNYSSIASPIFTGVPSAPTAASGANTTQIATTAFVSTAVASVSSGSGYAPLASPTFTGIPTAPTATAGTNTTQIATTAFVTAAAAAISSGSGYAPVANPTFTGTVTIPAGAAISGYLTSATATSTYAPIASPTLTGTPAAPTASAGTNTTQIATTAFVGTLGATKLTASNNLSDLTSPSQAITHLGLGGAATLNVGTVASTVMAGNDSRVTEWVSELDDPTNTLTLGAPAIVRGKVSLKLANNVVQGAGQTLTIRQQNFTAINNAISVAATNGKWFEPEDGTYEFYGSTGIVIPVAANGFRWAGSKNVNLWQFNTNVPILQQGDLTGSSSAYQQYIEGFSLYYGVSQTGHTGANSLTIGASANCTIKEFIIGSSANGNPSNIPMYLNTGGVLGYNCYENGVIFGGQTSLFSLGTVGGSNKFDNLYFCNGANTTNTSYTNVTGSVMSIFNSGYGGLYDNKFSRITIENVGCPNNFIFIASGTNNLFESLRIANCELTTAGVFFGTVGSHTTVNGMGITDLRTTTAGASLFSNPGYNDSLAVYGIQLSWTPFVNAGVTSPLYIVGVPGLVDNNGSTIIENLKVSDSNFNNASSLQLDNNNPSPMQGTIGSGYGTQMPKYRSGAAITETNGWNPTLNSSFTLYGCHNDAIIDIPAPLTASMTVTLSNVRSATSYASNLPTKTGNTARFRMQSGTYAHPVTIVDSASGNTIITISASATNAMAMFNGTNWISVAV
jgi:hypothetical protein